MTVKTTLLFLRYKSMRGAAFAHRLKTQLAAADNRKAMVPKAVPCRLGARDGFEKIVKTLARQIARPALRKEPPVERAAHHRLRPSRQPRNRERPVLADRIEGVHPGLDGDVVLLDELPRQGRARK